MPPTIVLVHGAFADSASWHGVVDRLLATGHDVVADTRQDAGYAVSLEWDRDTGQTQIVAGDMRNATQLVFRVPGANAGDAFRHPFSYAP